MLRSNYSKIQVHQESAQGVTKARFMSTRKALMEQLQQDSDPPEKCSGSKYSMIQVHQESANGVTKARFRSTRKELME